MAIFKWGVLLVVLLGGAVALGAGIATAHDSGTEVRITAMRLDDGRIEFAGCDSLKRPHLEAQ